MDTLIIVDCNDQPVTFLPGFLQIINMSRVQNIETAISEDNFFTPGSGLIQGNKQLLFTHDALIAADFIHGQSQFWSTNAVRT